MQTSSAGETFDVLIVGAGLSGIAAAYHLKTSCPGKRFAILEGRSAIGGTWDLFRYPGVRSDSDMHTLGYGFRPWPSDMRIVPAAEIRHYIADTARAIGVDSAIRFNTRVTAAEWSTDEARWTVFVENTGTGEHGRVFCNFLFTCCGYYDYASGYTPAWPQMDAFQGALVHPQFWDERLDYAGKRVVVIGSGATAVTLAPALTDKAEHVTILQRSPSYIAARPSVDAIARTLQRRLPSRLAGPLIRWKNIAYSILTFAIARRYPEKFSKLLFDAARKELGPDVDMDTHFTPTYKPWDQRVCLVPDADLFRLIRAGKIDVVTDHIERFTRTGVVLKSGRALDADVVVTATGLKIQLLGGIDVRVDGTRVDLGKTLFYKGMMFSGVPNLASAFGYTNASWTLKSELTAKYVCRLINYMTRGRFDYCVPTRPANMAEEPGLDFQSGYVLRAAELLPKQGTIPPWRNHQNYISDMTSLLFGKVDDGAMEFARVPAREMVRA